jgi:hypothetical protein
MGEKRGPARRGRREAAAAKRVGVRHWGCAFSSYLWFEVGRGEIIVGDFFLSWGSVSLLGDGFETGGYVQEYLGGFHSVLGFVCRFEEAG